MTIIGRSTRVLDVGTGIGTVAAHRRGAEVTACTNADGRLKLPTAALLAWGSRRPG